MKFYIILIIVLISLVGSGVVGYKIGSSTVKDGTIIVTESKPEIKEVIKYVDRTKPAEVDAALNSPIIICRNYSGITNGIITADIVASDNYKRSTIQDKIRIGNKTTYTTEFIIGGVAFIAGAIVTGYLLKKTGVIKLQMSQGKF